MKDIYQHINEAGGLLGNSNISGNREVTAQRFDNLAHYEMMFRTADAYKAGFRDGQNSQTLPRLKKTLPKPRNPDTIPLGERDLSEKVKQQIEESGLNEKEYVKIHFPAYYKAKYCK
jgi:hypothetical protein